MTRPVVNTWGLTPFAVVILTRPGNLDQPGGGLDSPLALAVPALTLFV